MDMATPVLDEQHKHTFIICARTLSAVEKTYPVRWSIGTDSDKETKESVLSGCLVDDES